MFGSIYRMTARQGREQAIEELFYRWDAEQRESVDGVVTGLLLKSGERPGELYGVAVFTSEDTYRKNAADPRQDAWYRRLRENLVADPEWTDGEFLLVARGSPGIG